MTTPIKSVEPLSRPWRGIDPFLFGMHHLDAYPEGNGALGPAPESLEGRDIGMDFSAKDGWSMYHGDHVPGFPGHPHRGFETVTIVPKGLVDHADSLGAAARYGDGDVQWLTAGRGIQHAEMFPLTATDDPNPLDLFQIWLNLPAKNKMADPEFKIFWAGDIPVARATDDAGRSTSVEVIAGDYAPVDPVAGQPATYTALPPPAASWASAAEGDVAMWLIRLDPGASLTLPAAKGNGTQRALYVYDGDGLVAAGHPVGARVMVELQADQPAPLTNAGDAEVAILMLQGRPIGEPVAARGPFVMNTQAELMQAFQDYQRTQFGGWPWPDHAVTHGDKGRFARHADGRIEEPGASATA